MSFPVLLAAADRAVATALGGPALYETSAGQLIELRRAVFDAGYVRADADQAGVVSTGPAVFVLLADLVTPDGRLVDPDTDPDPTVTIAGTAYTVREVRRDGVGGVVLLLHEAG